MTHSVVLYEPTETSAEVKAAAGFLAGYSGRTRETYTLDLRHFYGWCDKHHLRLFEVTRTHIELYARELEEFGRAPATIGRGLSTLLVPSWSHRSSFGAWAALPLFLTVPQFRKRLFGRRDLSPDLCGSLPAGPPRGKGERILGSLSSTGLVRSCWGSARAAEER